MLTKIYAASEMSVLRPSTAVHRDARLHGELPWPALRRLAPPAAGRRQRAGDAGARRQRVPARRHGADGRRAAQRADGRGQRQGLALAQPALLLPGNARGPGPGGGGRRVPPCAGTPDPRFARGWAAAFTGRRLAAPVEAPRAVLLPTGAASAPAGSVRVVRAGST